MFNTIVTRSSVYLRVYVTFAYAWQFADTSVLCNYDFGMSLDKLCGVWGNLVDCLQRHMTCDCYLVKITPNCFPFLPFPL